MVDTKEWRSDIQGRNLNLHELSKKELIAEIVYEREYFLSHEKDFGEEVEKQKQIFRSLLEIFVEMFPETVDTVFGRTDVEGMVDELFLLKED